MDRRRVGFNGSQVMDDLSRFCCQNPHCADFGKRGAKNLARIFHRIFKQPI